MKFILDENVPSNIKSMLLNLGHNALDLSELDMLSAKNGEVGKLAIDQNAILLTMDADFLHLKKEIKNLIRVIYIHLKTPNPFMAEKLLQKNLNASIAKLRRPGIITLESGD